jgi:ABC-type Mn2+/Zn2+ transport system ATPase subunit
MLRRIVLENYRSCLRTSIDLHPKLSVLIGPNGSGKTNILQGIMLLNQLAHGPEHALGQRRLTTTSRLKAIFHSPNSNANLRASVDAYTNESNNDVVLKTRQRWLLGTTARRPQEFTSEIPLEVAGVLGTSFASSRNAQLYAYRRYFQSHVYHLRKGMVPGAPVPKWARPIFASIAKYCEGIRYYGASQFTNPGSCPTSFEIEREGHQRSLHRIRGHARILSAMYSASKRESNRQYEQFMEIVGPKGLRLIDGLTFRDVKTSSTEYSVRVGGKVESRRRDNLLIIPQFKVGRQTLSPNQLSEGTFKTLALLFHVITEDCTALLIEEPEVCVHQGLLASILELIKSYSSHKQMILSTHSDYVLDKVDPENVYRVTLTKNEGTIARHIRKTMTAKDFAALRRYLETEGNLGDYWREGALEDRP